MVIFGSGPGREGGGGGGGELELIVMVHLFQVLGHGRTIPPPP